MVSVCGSCKESKELSLNGCLCDDCNLKDLENWFRKQELIQEYTRKSESALKLYYSMTCGIVEQDYL